MDAEAYLRQFQAVLPLGSAWTVENDSNLTALLAAFAEEYARAEGRSVSLVQESDPRLTDELLFDWERAYGLPTDCKAGIAQTLQQRINALVAQISGIGGASRAYFISLALSAGFVITITEFTPFSVKSTVDESILGPGWQFAFQVNGPSATVTHFTVASTVNEALQTWGNELLECLIRRYKPAHTAVLFAYS